MQDLDELEVRLSRLEEEVRRLRRELEEAWEQINLHSYAIARLERG